MRQFAAISLSGNRKYDIDRVLERLYEISKKTNVILVGPNIFPPQKTPIPMKNKDGRYLINFTEFHFVTVYLEAEVQALRMLMRISVPDGVTIEIILRN